MEVFEEYVDDVQNGHVTTNELVKKTVQRHVDDLVNGHKRGLYFDRNEAKWVCDTFPKLFKHSAGELAGQPFHLTPWQAFIVSCAFGWKHKATGFRRFRRIYIEVARRNGKSTLLAAIALFMLFLDGEPAAQIYSAATKRDQAKIVWGEAKKMVRANRELSKHIETYRDSIVYPGTDSIFVPLASDSKSLDGLNIHGAVVDELHAHDTREVWDVLDTATGSRQQPMIWAITTAGFNQNGICYEIRQMVIDILNGTNDNDSWFGFIAGLDPDDLYSDQSKWEKANPNLPYISTLPPDLQEKAKRAATSAGEMNNFLVKHMCRWTTSAQSWLRIGDWDKCKAQKTFTYEEMKGRPAFVGLDLSEKLDLTAVSICFPPVEDGEHWRYLWRFFLPRDTVERYVADGETYWRDWENSKQLTVTPGGITDENEIRRVILQIKEDFDLRMVGHDPRKATRLVGELLDHGIEMVEINQHFSGMSEATKTFEAQLRTGLLEHNGESLMRWQATNVALQMDYDGNMRPIRPQKNSNKRKVDGVVAAVLACAVAIRMPIASEAIYACLN